MPIPTAPLAALLIFATAAAAGADAPPPPRTLAVTGEGEARAAPDLARAVIGVAIRRPAAGEAMGAASAAMTAVLDALAAAGAAPGDLETRAIELNPVWEWDEAARANRQAGFEARQTVELTVRDLARLGPALDAAAAAGATELGGVGFDVADRGALEEAARRAAVRDAAATAALLAEAAGQTLGAPLSITLGGGFAPAPLPMRAAAPMADAAAAPPPPVAAGEIAVTATVSVGWEMK
jgi:uncharacterized protein YggE